MLYLIIICLVFIAFLIFNTYFVLISKITIKAKVRDSFLFVHISDIHGTTRFINGRLSCQINKLCPDFVVVTGDLSNNRKQLPKTLKELERIKAKHGVIMVLGNYEGQELKGFRKINTDINISIEMIKTTQGIALLQNEYCLLQIGQNKVLIYGFDNSTYGREEYSSEVEQIKSDYKIILAHSPNIIKCMETNNITSNQILAGHTHGGQINIFKNRHLRQYREFHTGVKKYGNSLFCINRGLGTVKIPFRFNCYPEISVYNIIPEQSP